MTSPPDKFFRDGLEHYSKPAPVSAWSRIESGLDRKRNRSPWLKIAAGLLLMLAASVLFWQSNQSDSGIATVSKESSSTSMVTDTMVSSTKEESKVINRESSVVSREVREGGTKPLAGKLKKGVDSQESSVVSRESSEGHQELANASKETTITSIVEPNEKMAEPIPQIQVEVVDEITTNDIVQEQKGINVTYSAKEVNAKYLKQEQTPDATPEKKNTSGLQKVIDRALDLKYEESVLADLREKKNEWLSLNIPSKQRETNK